MAISPGRRNGDSDCDKGEGKRENERGIKLIELESGELGYGINGWLDLRDSKISPSFYGKQSH